MSREARVLCGRFTANLGEDGPLLPPLLLTLIAAAAAAAGTRGCGGWSSRGAITATAARVSGARFGTAVSGHRQRLEE